MSNHEELLIDAAKKFLSLRNIIKYDYEEQEPMLHIQRKNLIKTINNKFIDYTKRYKENPDPHIILRWFYTQKMFDITNKDPILPYSKDLNEGLIYELEKYRVPMEDIIELNEIINDMIYNYEPIKYLNGMEVELYNKGRGYIIKYGDMKFELSKDLFDRLKRLYNAEDEYFIYRTFNLLCRYYSLSSPGYHSAIPKEVFKILKEDLGVMHEIFASPFNCNLDINSYTSAYPDTDKFFSSKGNFYDKREELFFNGGSFEANPPFLEEHMITFSILVIEALKRPVPLSFVIIYPAWMDSISLKMLIDSEFNILEDKVLVFDEKEHFYEQSSQYCLKIGNIKVSGSKSALFILQNKEGKKKYGLYHDTVKKIKQSFST